MKTKSETANEIRECIGRLNELVCEAKEMNLTVEINADNQSRSLAQVEYSAKITETTKF